MLLTVAGVTALHAALLLHALQPQRDARLPDPRPGPALRWRVLALPVEPPARPVPVPAAVAPRPDPGPVPRQAAPAPRPVPVLPTLSLALADAAALEVEAASSAPQAGAAPDAQGAADTPPVYATALAPPLSRRYRLARGALSGTAELRWAPGADGRYAAALAGDLAGERVLDWRSTGALDAAGIAPERYVTRGRGGRGAQAANFQREAGKLSYAGPAVEFALVPGAQDRLTVLLQVPAIVAADPQRFQAGARLKVFVTGARGDADVWDFEVEAEEDVAGADGTPVRALRLAREPRKRFDTQVKLWLDPARAFLPLRVRLWVPGAGEALDLLLESEEKLP
ncbi:DUF3108 domain-containing protein [Azohydromonas aeria]|uniref:DUF3108 domain-containing protein n=1 Tax=Azohydromonas aeria TaxID=2590212 RepID=UPI0012F848AE|nr:DUF3108 domain-containing protein [Azohydromonas aeria]